MYCVLFSNLLDLMYYWPLLSHRNNRQIRTLSRGIVQEKEQEGPCCKWNKDGNLFAHAYYAIRVNKKITFTHTCRANYYNNFNSLMVNERARTVCFRILSLINVTNAATRWRLIGRVKTIRNRSTGLQQQR